MTRAAKNPVRRAGGLDGVMPDILRRSPSVGRHVANPSPSRTGPLATPTDSLGQGPAAATFDHRLAARAGVCTSATIREVQSPSLKGQALAALRVGGHGRGDGQGDGVVAGSRCASRGPRCRRRRWGWREGSAEASVRSVSMATRSTPDPGPGWRGWGTSTPSDSSRPPPVHPASPAPAALVPPTPSLPPRRQGQRPSTRASLAASPRSAAASHDRTSDTQSRPLRRPARAGHSTRASATSPADPSKGASPLSPVAFSPSVVSVEPQHEAANETPERRAALQRMCTWFALSGGTSVTRLSTSSSGLSPSAIVPSRHSRCS